jgi:hypothetical protein
MLTVGRTMARVFQVAVGAAVIGWGISGIARDWSDAALEHMYQAIIAGDNFRADVVAPLSPMLDTVDEAADCDNIASEATTAVRLVLTDQAFSEPAPSVLDQRLTALDRSARRSLACAPSQSFQWLVLFWVENIRDGFNTNRLDFLRMSYRTGPNEAWIALKRNWLAFALFRSLPPDLTEATLNEFVGLIDAGFYDYAADVLTGPAWSVREFVTDHLGHLDGRQRDRLAKLLYVRGSDINVPGVTRRPPRPWQ